MILMTAADAALDFAYYDREEDEDLPAGVIEDAIARKVVTPEEIVTAFSRKLHEFLGPGEEAA